MPTRQTYYYVDTCVILSYLSRTPDRIDLLDALFEEISNDPETKLITSTFTIAEATFTEAENGARDLDQNDGQAIEAFWNDYSLIELADFNVDIAQISRGLVRQTLFRQPRLHVKDAVHVATYKWLTNSGITISDFFSYDQGLIEVGQLFNVHICEPYLLQPRLFNRLGDASN